MILTPVFVSFLALVATPALAGQSPRELNHHQMARTFGFSGLSTEKCYGSPKAPWESGCYPGWYSGSECGPVKGHQPKKWDGGDKNQCGKPHSKDWECCKNKAPHHGKHGPHLHSPHHSPSHGGSHTKKPKCTKKPSKPHSTHDSESTPTSTTSYSKPHQTNPVEPPTKCDGEFEQTFKNYTTIAKTGYYQGQSVGAAIIDIPHYLTYGLVDTTAECLDNCENVKACRFVNIYQEFNSTIKDEMDNGAGKGKLTCALFDRCSGPKRATNYAGQDDPTYIVNSYGYCKSGNCDADAVEADAEDDE